MFFSRIWPISAIIGYFKSLDEADQKAREEWRQTVQMIDDFRGFRRHIWLDDQVLYATYSAAPGKTLTRSMVSNARLEFLQSLGALSWDYSRKHSWANPPDLGGKKIFEETLENKNDENELVAITFKGGYENRDMRASVGFDSDWESERSINGWLDKMKREGKLPEGHPTRI